MATLEPLMAGVAGRYASALFDLAGEKKAVTVAEQDLANIKAMLDESADLRALVRSPVISVTDQIKALGAVLKRAGIGELVSNFVLLVAKNRRLFALGDMIKAFQTLAAKARGEVAAEVASAVPLNEQQLASLKDALKVSVGKDVTISTKVDPSLLAGLVVKVGSRMVDSSLKTKLQSMRVALKATG